MEAMYQKFGKQVEFRLVYITEAHATDSKRPVDYANDLGITQHQDLNQRCVTAEMLRDDKQLTIPFVIDRMDNAVNRAYQAHPDRVFLVRTDGRLAVAAARGPFGFAPALEETRRWLEEFKSLGKEPELPADHAPAGKEQPVAPPKRNAPSSP